MKLVKTLSEVKNAKPEELKEIAVAAIDVPAILEEGIKDANEKWKTEKDQAANALKSANEAKASFETKAKELEENLKNVNSELKTLKEKAVAEELNKKFQERMAGLDSEYDLSDDDRKVIAKQIKDKDEDNFKTWVADFSVIAASKKKQAKANDEKKDESKVATASTKQETTDALDKAKEDGKSKVANATVTDDNLSLADKYKKAFSMENIVISK